MSYDEGLQTPLCTECQRPISGMVSQFSLNRYKRALCMDCQKKQPPMPPKQYTPRPRYSPTAPTAPEGIHPATIGMDINNTHSLALVIMKEDGIRYQKYIEAFKIAHGYVKAASTWAREQYK